jgi:hypothetical protein
MRDRVHWAAGIALLAAVTGAGVAQEPAAPKAEPPETASFGTTVVVPGGLRGDIYFIHDDTVVLPNFKKLEPVGTIWTSRLNVPPRHWRDGFPGITTRFEWFALDFNGRFWIETPGRYTFALLSDDGSRLYIDDKPIIDNDCQHTPDIRKSAVKLAGGAHRIRVSYFQGPRDCLALVLAIAGPEGDWRVFSTDEFKPPANPADWKYGSSNDLAVEKNQDGKRAKLRDEVGKPGARPKLEIVLGLEPDSPERAPGTGCISRPVRFCGYTPTPDLPGPDAPVGPRPMSMPTPRP